MRDASGLSAIVTAVDRLSVLYYLSEGDELRLDKNKSIVRQYIDEAWSAVIEVACAMTEDKTEVGE